MDKMESPNHTKWDCKHYFGCSQLESALPQMWLNSFNINKPDPRQ